MQDTAQQQQVKDLHKVMRVGTIDTGNGRRASVYIEATIKDGKLSMTGVIGPLPSGNSVGGCGQIDMEFAHRDAAHDDKRHSEPIRPRQISFAPHWDSEKWLDLLDVWHRWHLNDMRAWCEHQVGPEWDASTRLTLYHFRTRGHVREVVRAFKDRAEQALRAGQSVRPTPKETRLACLPDKITLSTPELSTDLGRDYEPERARYDGDHYNKASEEKTAGWVYPADHPGGLLTKPCPVCGYKYGSAWLKEQLPEAVAVFLQSLPDTDKTPAWV